ncbi:hypothetical protein FPOAC1_005765 [Fusarium poae]|nr:hypothetical protein FPOAC1_005765 [Fusarium poae]KAG8672490.1 hypothetical protein FPOAC1_005765 [Fusarium poae]
MQQTLRHLPLLFSNQTSLAPDQPHINITKVISTQSYSIPNSSREYILSVTMPDQGVSVQQARGAFMSAQKDWDNAKTSLVSLQTTYNEKKTLAEDISNGRQSRSTPDKVIVLGVEIEELKGRIEVIEKKVIEYRTQMDTAKAIFEKLEGYEVLDKVPGLSG